MEPRPQPGAYFTDGHRLFEVIDQYEGRIVLENCENQTLLCLDAAVAHMSPWKRVLPLADEAAA